jgi:putative ATPase
MKSLGYGNEYKYPHDFQGGFVKEDYFPEGLTERQFFRPTVYGKEKGTRDRMKSLWPERFSGEKK